MIEKTVAELSAALAAGEISSVELTQAFLARIDQYNDVLNAYITVCSDSALQQARAADAARAAGNDSPLLGIPLAHKDIFCTEGVTTTCGSRMLENFVSPYNATVVERLNAAGAVMLGKTNMDEFAMGSSNETSYFGPVRNPWDTNRVPGGSSGGSAAAVAADLVRHGHRHRYRRLDSPASRLYRHHRIQAQLRQGLPLGHDCFRLQPRSGRTAVQKRRGCGADDERHGRPG